MAGQQKETAPRKRGRRAEATHPSVVLMSLPHRNPMSKGSFMTERVVAYIDGFNLYFGLKAHSGRKDLWPDLQLLVECLLRGNQELREVWYFTARTRDEPDAERRQAVYLDALASYCPRVRRMEGRFQPRIRSCRYCQARWVGYEEKETDVNIAVALVEDAVLDTFDTALLVTADSDLCPAVAAVKRLRPAKRVIAAFRPGETP